MQVGWVKIGDFRQITGYISKTVKDITSFYSSRIGSRMRSIEWRHCRWPWVPPNHPNHPIFCISHRHLQLRNGLTGEPRDFIFGTLTHHSTSHPAEKKSSYTTDCNVYSRSHAACIEHFRYLLTGTQVLAKLRDRVLGSKLLVSAAALAGIVDGAWLGGGH